MPNDHKDACPVCLGSFLVTFLERDRVPVFQNVLYSHRSDALDVDRGELRMRACASCGFVFNAAFDPAKSQYDRRYDNNQTCSTEFRDYLHAHIQRLADDPDLRSGTIVEVGCGSGWFLERLVAATPQGRGIGFDPAYRGPEESLGGRIRYERRLFEAQDARCAADVVISRHVIEHVADPVALLMAVRAALARSRHPRVFFETPCVDWILRNQVIFDFFYEHCSYFNPRSLRTAFGRAGFDVASVEHVFGRQYLWLEATTADADGSAASEAGDVLSLAAAFAEHEHHVRAAWIEQIQRLRRTGNVAVWGAGAKGVTFLNVIDPGAQLIDCAVDISPDKQGRFVGGTGHPVVGVEQLAQRGVTSALLMNPNYRDENMRLLSAAEVRVELVG